MKKLLSILLTLVMILSLATTAFATDEGAGDTPVDETETGTITIDDAVPGVTYSVYKMLTLESYDPTVDADPNTDGVQGAYAYKAASDAWGTWLATQTTYVSVDANGYVTWVGGNTAPAFAKAALEFAKGENSGVSCISKVAETPADEDAVTVTVTFTDLELGYYLVDSSLGALCSLNTTDPDATIEEKNDPPSLDKKVKEDSVTVTEEDDGYRSSNTAGIGETVTFRATITAQPGAENYVLHDTMSDGLDFGRVTAVTHVTDTVSTTLTDSEYTLSAPENTDQCDNCDFHVVFNQDFCNTLKANDKIIVEYTAVLNAKAVIDGDNTNVAKLTYGDNHTVDVQTVTKTFDVTVFKWTAGSKDLDGTVQKKPLEGAGFTLYYDEACESVVKIVATDAANVYQVCEVNDCSTHNHSDNEIVTGDTGIFTIEGLDAATYYLKETTVPAGYNEVHPNPITITIGEDGVVNEVAKNENGVDLEIENKTGTELPETGGMGTTLIYTLGAILAVGSLILLVVKKRMSAAE